MRTRGGVQRVEALGPGDWVETSGPELELAHEPWLWDSHRHLGPGQKRVLGSFLGLHQSRLKPVQIFLGLVQGFVSIH